MKVVRISYSDGGTTYYIDGNKDESIQDDRDLLDRLVGHTLDSIRDLGIEPIPWGEGAEPFWDIEYQKTLDDLIAHIERYPQLINENDLAIVKGLA